MENVDEINQNLFDLPQHGILKFHRIAKQINQPSRVVLCVYDYIFDSIFQYDTLWRSYCNVFDASLLAIEYGK